MSESQGAGLDSASDTYRDVTALEFVELFKSGNSISDVRVEDPIDDDSIRALKQFVVDKDVLMEHCVFKYPLRLEALASAHHAHFSHCKFEQGIDASGTLFKGTLSLIYCRIDAFAESYRPDAALDLTNSEFVNDIEIRHCDVRGKVCAVQMNVGGSLRLRGVQVGRSRNDADARIPVNGIDESWQQQSKPNPARPREKLGVFDISGAHVGGDLEFYPGLDFGSDVPYKAMGSAEYLALERLSENRTMACVIFGDLEAERVTVGGSLQLAGLLCFDTMNFSRMHVLGNVYTWFHDRAKTKRSVKAHRLFMKDARVDGDVSLRFAVFEEDLNLYHVRVEGNLNLSGTAVGRHLHLHFCVVRGYFNALLDPTLCTPGTTHLSVGGQMSMSGCDISYAEIRAVDIAGPLIVRTGTFGELTFGTGLTAIETGAGHWIKPCQASGIEMYGLTVSGDLVLDGIVTSATAAANGPPGTRDFILSHCRIGRHLRIGPPDRRLDIVEAYPSAPWVRPRPDDSGAINNPPAEPFPQDVSAQWDNLDLRANHIGGNLNLRNVRIKGRIQINDTQIGLDLEMGCDFIYENARRTTLQTTCARLDLEKLVCDGDVSLTGLRTHVDTGRGTRSGKTTEDCLGEIDGRGMKVRGEMLLVPRLLHEGGSEPVKTDDGKSRDLADVQGNVDLTASEIQHLVLTGENFSNTPRKTINLERTQIGKLEIVKPPIATINLSGIKVTRWDFSTRQNKEEDTANNYINVLKQMDQHDRMVWIEVETARRNEGRNADANEIYMAMRKHARKEMKSRTWALFVDSMDHLMTGYRTQVWRPMILVLFFFLPLSIFIFQNPLNITATSDVIGTIRDAREKGILPPVNLGKEKSADQPAEKEGGALKIATAESVLNLSPQDIGHPWTWVDGLIMSIRYQVPIINILTHSKWQANSRLLAPHLTVERYAFIVEIYHWIAWPLFLIGLTANVFRGRRG